MNKDKLIETVNNIIENLNENDNYSIEIRNDECLYSKEIGKTNKDGIINMVSNAFDISINQMRYLKMDEMIIYIDQFDLNNNFVKNVLSRMI